MYIEKKNIYIFKGKIWERGEQGEIKREQMAPIVCSFLSTHVLLPQENDEYFSLNIKLNNASVRGVF